MVDTFCTKCGASLESNSNFCTKCGSKIISETKTRATSDNFPKNKLYEQNKHKQIGTGKAIVIGMGVFFLFLLILGAVLFGGSSKNDNLVDSTNKELVDNKKSLIQMIEDRDLMRFDGLTSGQTNIVKLIEDECDNQAMMASLAGETAEQIYTQKCNQVIERKINEFNYGNTVKNAIETRDVSLCDNVPDNLICIKEYALALNEPDVCIGTGYMEEPCITETAKKYDQIETCNLLKENTSCIYQFAYADKDISMCEKATNQSLCLDNFAESADLSICKILDEVRMETCYKKYVNQQIDNISEGYDWSGYTEHGKSAIDCRNPAIGTEFDLYSCRIKALISSESPMDISKDIILNAKTEDYGGLAICKAIDISQASPENPVPYAQCLASLATYYNDYTMCDEIPNTDYDYKSSCYGTIAFTNPSVDIEICDTLSDPSLCYVGNAYRLNDKSICDDLEKITFKDLQGFRDNCIRAIQEKNKS